ncbi:MAG TPA: type IV toxin-antitoxin system AbiEi family antitoxin domain-containing protein [Solirubrobacteraceae bacterium]|nr:type IV toxin-antitoxin system AbiEi family antitoxin domain-containing protein [Solirubrobacteraceae bacterium]
MPPRDPSSFPPSPGAPPAASHSGAGKVCPSGAVKGSPRSWEGLAELSRGQDGAVSVAQFAALGFDRRRLTLLVRQGRFVRRHRASTSMRR